MKTAIIEDSPAIAARLAEIKVEGICNSLELALAETLGPKWARIALCGPETTTAELDAYYAYLGSLVMGCVIE